MIKTILLGLLCGLTLTACNLVVPAGVSETPTASLPLVTPSALPLTATLPPATLLPTAAVESSITPPPLLNESVSPTPLVTETAVIVSPLNGTIVTGSPLAVSGIVYNLPTDQFVLELLDSAGNSINRQTITLRNPNRIPQVSWSASLMTQYRGSAILRVITRGANGQEFVAATVSITIGAATSGSAAATTANPQVTIDIPSSGATVSGDPIQISGTVGGLADGRFSLQLLSATGVVLTEQEITFTSSDPSLMVPWSASFGTSGATGPVELRAVYRPAGSSDPITLSLLRIILR